MTPEPQSNKDKLRVCLIMAAGDDPAAQHRILLKYGTFTSEAGREVKPRSVEAMTEAWATVSLERLLDAVKDGQEHLCYNEQGEKVQGSLFDDPQESE